KPLLGDIFDLIAPLIGMGLRPDSHVTNRCPGSAAQTAADGSNPWPAGHEGGCAVNQVPPGGTAKVAP
ncbi:MAG: MCE family protein, partial [Solirubrobacteraceae bacterium]